jgi:hypothetical protein
MKRLLLDRTITLMFEAEQPKAHDAPAGEEP